MSTVKPTTISHFFEKLPDFRIERTKRHDLIDIVFISLCAVICGFDEGWEDIETFAKERESWLKNYISLDNGVPSHDTIRRVFMRLDPKALQSAFIDWIQAVTQHNTDKRIISVDGKTVRGSRARGHNAIHMVSAWCHEHNMVLGQCKVGEKTNEITAIPALLELLDIQGSVITVDAMGCQTKIAQTIIDKKAEYVFGLKGNQGTINEQVRAWFEIARQEQYKNLNVSAFEQVSGDHGRIEQRQCIMVDSQSIEGLNDWPGIQSVICIHSQREVNNQVQSETRYYLSSLAVNAERACQVVRAHWGIENSLHWCLDVTFNEDQCRISSGHAPQVMAVMRHTALNLLKQESSMKTSIRKKKIMAILNEDYLTKVIHAI
jgi:predicted transposase YbfD/YdcC